MKTYPDGENLTNWSRVFATNKISVTIKNNSRVTK
jgi:hypothetical protein